MRHKKNNTQSVILSHLLLWGDAGRLSSVSVVDSISVKLGYSRPGFCGETLILLTSFKTSATFGLSVLLHRLFPLLFRFSSDSGDFGDVTKATVFSLGNILVFSSKSSQPSFSVGVCSIDC